MLLPLYQKLWAPVGHANDAYVYILVTELWCLSLVTYKNGTSYKFSLRPSPSDILYI